MFNYLEISPGDLERKQKKKKKKRMGEKRKRGKGRKWEVNLLDSEKQKCNPDHRRKKTVNMRILYGTY